MILSFSIANMSSIITYRVNLKSSFHERGVWRIIIYYYYLNNVQEDTSYKTPKRVDHHAAPHQLFVLPSRFTHHSFSYTEDSCTGYPEGLYEIRWNPSQSVIVFGILCYDQGQQLAVFYSYWLKLLKIPHLHDGWRKRHQVGPLTMTCLQHQLV